MVEKISKLSPTAPSNATRIDQSVSVAEPDIAWVANRQSVIDAALSEAKTERLVTGEDNRAFDGEEEARGGQGRGHAQSETDEGAELLSGESKRIGTGNLDDEQVAFGGHTGFV
ncbi:hypothetical protein J5277_30435 [Rhizobium sp. 16-449-1b]|uniref:hypothetical protein n=1 Tax=Rhizobium sp. 16-449-1b TaxID=2819989 RepID=UPI001ADA4F51|nr:hypothetical protein [Rhizobium sp. 16-449-1b]MBO9198444.1 hypothetical protein [Rhizobium sp. 16-449-1b]